MDFSKHPERTERLAAAYALGTLRGGARRRFEQLAQRHPHVRAAALTWQGRMAGLTELQKPIAPPAAVWTRIDNLLQASKDEARIAAQRAPQARMAGATDGWWQRLALWRGLTGASVLAGLVGAWVAVGVQQEQAQTVARLQTELQALAANTPRIEYVAVLAGAQGQAGPEVLVTFDAQRQRLTLQRVGGYREADDRSLQLWALPAGGTPRSLGVLGAEPKLQLTAAPDAVQAVPALAISLEPKGGVPSEGGPTGPVLFSGPLVHASL